MLSALFLAHCNRAERMEPCNSDLCEKYLDVWGQLLRSRNALSEEWTDKHIKAIRYEIRNHSSYDIFAVRYEIQIDWAKFQMADELTIRVNSDETLFPALEIARGPYLEAMDIDKCLDIHAFGSEMVDISGPIDHLRFGSQAAAMRALEDACDHSLILPELFWNRSGLLFPEIGHPMLRASGTINDAENSCISGRIDLVTGYASWFESPCRVY